MNKLVEKMKSGKPVFGTFYKLNSNACTEILAYAGFDFIVVDCEHANISWENYEGIINSANRLGMEVIIRVPAPREEYVFHALDSGANGVQLPNIETVNQARDILAACKYYPKGQRGLSRNQKAGHYGIWTDDIPYPEYANGSTMVVMHIENKDMAEKTKDLCDCDNADVLFIGPADLSQSMGMPGQTKNPEVVAVINKVIAEAGEKGMLVGTTVSNEESIRKYMDMGVKYFLYGSDYSFLANGAKNAMSIINKFKE